jgi:hypothetical protein
MLWLVLALACSKGHDSGPVDTDVADTEVVDTGPPTHVPDAATCNDTLSVVSLDGAYGEGATGLDHCWTTDILRGRWDRTEAVSCEGTQVPPHCSTEGGSCSDDAECGPGGVCADAPPYVGGCACTLPCVADADCGAGSACLCAAAFNRGEAIRPLAWGNWNACVPSTCATDADCADGACTAAFDGMSHVPHALACHDDTRDRCSYDSDCGDSEVCDLNDNGHWACEAAM